MAEATQTCLIGGLLCSRHPYKFCHSTPARSVLSLFLQIRKLRFRKVKNFSKSNSLNGNPGFWLLGPHITHVASAWFCRRLARVTLGKVKRITLGQLAHLSGPGGSDSGLGCLLKLRVKVGHLRPLPGLDCFMGKWKAWLPGTCRKTGMGFLLPSPRVSHNCEFRRAFESAFKISNRLGGFDSLPASEAGQGLSLSVSLPVPSSWGSEQ